MSWPPETAYEWGLVAYFAICIITTVALMRIDAPYGRHNRPGWGPNIPSRAAWIGMEAPSVLVAAAVFLAYGPTSAASWVLFAVWQLHYVQRTFVFPFLIKAKGKTMPLLIAGIAFVYNGFNSWMNHGWISHYGEYTAEWLQDPRFIAGLALFLAGFFVNLRSDQILRNLRKPGETGYKIPKGFLYRYVSCPNYLGEMMEWFGWALMTWSLPGLAFALYTVANLGPRALANHRWYRDKCPDYPTERKALIPFVL